MATYVIQPRGMNHILRLKQEALMIWDEEFNKQPSAWIDCLEAVLVRHRITMAEQDIAGFFDEKIRDRRSQKEINKEMDLDFRQQEIMQRIRDAESVFDNQDADE